MADENNQNSVEMQMAVDTALKAQKKKKKKKTFIIVGVIIAIIVIISAVSGSGDDVKQVDNNSNSASVSDTTKTTEKEEEEKTVFKKGESVQINDLKITFTDCDSDYKNYNEYQAPENGMKYVKATFTFENTGTSDKTLDSFDCYADDLACDEDFFLDGSNPATLESISSGKKFNAVVYYQVPKDSKDIVLQYETSYWSSNYVEFVIE